MSIYRLLTLLLLAPSALAQHASVQYLANEALLVENGDDKVLFDPLFDNGFGTYQMVPASVRAAIFAGDAPFDGVDAVFVSHYHGDHFSAGDMLRLLRERPDVRVYAPAQAVVAIRELASDEDQPLFDRVTGLDLDYGDSPVSIDAGGILVDAAHIPHSGWPTARTDVQNIAFRITLGGDATVLHLGDADPRIVHFAAEEEFWEERAIDLAFPPYWFFGSEDGIEILEDRLDITNSIGIHVPEEYSNLANMPEELLRYELFTRPGEGRRF